MRAARFAKLIIDETRTGSRERALALVGQFDQDYGINALYGLRRTTLLSDLQRRALPKDKVVSEVIGAVRQRGGERTWTVTSAAKVGIDL